MSRSILFSALMALAVVTNVKVALGEGGAEPVPWPPVHTHVEMMWNVDKPTEAASNKLFYYDFPSLSMRVDTSGFQSYWLGDTLSMIVPGVFCNQIDMGFGIMRPDWMVGNSTNEGDLWLTRRLQRSPGYDHTRWNRKSALPDGWFDYFSVFATGEPYRMSAPSPMGKVVNEYYDFVPQTSFPAGTFTLPAICKNKTATFSMPRVIRSQHRREVGAVAVMAAVQQALEPLRGHVAMNTVVPAMQTLVAQAMATLRN